MMLETAKCPNCKQILTEKTLIEPKQFSTSDNVCRINRSMQHLRLMFLPELRTPTSYGVVR